MIDKDHEKQTRGILYRCLTFLVFLIVLLGAESDCRKVLEGHFTADCATHAATSGEIAVMFAAVYAVFDPKAFIAVFGGLIQAVLRFWARVTGQLIVDVRTAPSAIATQNVAINQTRAKTVRDPSNLSEFWNEFLRGPGIPIAVVLIASAAILLLPLLPRPTATVSQRSSIISPIESNTSTDEVSMPPAKQLEEPEGSLETYVVKESDSCTSIARRYCVETRWQEFADHNHIKVIRRGGWLYCDIHPGDSFEFPTTWRDTGCRTGSNSPPLP